MSTKLSIGTWLLALSLASACGDEVDVFDGEGSSTYTLDNICDQLPEKLCASRMPCCEDAGYSYDEAGCLATERSNCEANQTAAQNGDITFDKNNVDACLEELDRLISQCFLTVAERIGDLSLLFDLCGTIFRGDNEVNDACSLDAECAPPNNGTAGCSPSNVCEQLRIRARGETCSFAEGDLCDRGLYCDVAVGQMPPATMGTCEAALGIGDACDSATAPGACGLGAYCNAATSDCTPAKDGGDSCMFAIECQSVECTNNTCAPVEPLVDAEDCGG